MNRSASCSSFISMSRLSDDSFETAFSQFRQSEEAEVSKELFRVIRNTENGCLSPLFFKKQLSEWSIFQKVHFIDYLVERRNLLHGDPVAKATACVRHFLPDLRTCAERDDISAYFDSKLEHRDNIIRQLFGLSEIT